MQLKRVNRDQPERLFVVFQANEAGIAADDTVQLELTAASVNGVKIVQPNANEAHAVIGVADAAIGNGSYGLVQVGGYRSTARIFATNTSQALAALLVPTASADYLSSVASSTTSSADVVLQPAMAVLLETIASTSASATISKKVWIRNTI